jgi:hypothetical protein
VNPRRAGEVALEAAALGGVAHALGASGGGGARVEVLKGDAWGSKGGVEQPAGGETAAAVSRRREPAAPLFQ